MVVGSYLIAVTYISDISPVSSKELPAIQATIECRLTLKCARGMKTYSQMHGVDKYS